MSDPVLLAIITGMLTLISTTITAIVAYMMARLNKQATTTIKEVAEVKKVSEAVHVLVNSSFSAQLEISSIALRRVSELTKDPEDMKAAILAESALEDHRAKQRIIDAGDKIAI